MQSLKEWTNLHRNKKNKNNIEWDWFSQVSVLKQKILVKVRKAGRELIEITTPTTSLRIEGLTNQKKLKGERNVNSMQIGKFTYLNHYLHHHHHQYRNSLNHNKAKKKKKGKKTTNKSSTI